MTTINKTDMQDRQRTRERLKREKPAVYDKLVHLDQTLGQVATPPPVIEIAYRYDCNLTCRHCFANRFDKKEQSLSLEDLKDLSLQAKELGVYQFILQGGEPLFWPDLGDVIHAIGPREFYMGLITNATLLNHEKITFLRNIGIDKIVISLDSFDVAQYEEIRNRQGLYQHTIHMLIQAKEAGLRVVINGLVTKQNVRSPLLLELIEFAKKHEFALYVNFASPIGRWEGRYDLLLDKEDADYIYDLNRQHEVIKRDIYPYMGKKVGCPALRSIVYITQYGDVLPCPFVHVAVGNILNEPLAQIIEQGMKIKWFKDRPPVCLACEDRDFIKNKISKIYGKPSPANMHDIFDRDEFC